ncbi:AraC family transcriptional regulator [Pedobacter nyackensis]|uniref:AraC family transcriptional regulator n=1 Tax=Pedobacter nyackensis TaxID=475255 RepID=UPI00292DAF38|nr:AraC family transcriptional regulator [Pedobacter nyackensis]
MGHPVIEQKKSVKEGFIGQRMIVLPPNIKRKISKNPLTKNFYLTAIGHYPKALNHERERKTGSNQYIFIYCVDGAGCIYIDDQRHELHPNTFFIIPKNISHRYHSSETTPWTIYWVHFTGLLSENIYERYSEAGKPTAQTIPYDENRIKFFEEIYSIMEHSFNDKEMEAANFNLLHFISSFIYYKESHPEVYNTDSISSSITFMKQHIHETPGIEQLAKQQNVSISHYSRSFKQKTGLSPINYFNQLKIQKSCQYLYFTDRSIKQIALDLGFDDQYYFSRLFKNVIGVSPAIYKKQHKK